MLVPAGGAGNDGNTSFHTANNVGNHGVRRSEINDHIDFLERGWREGAAILIFLAGQRPDFMPALFGYFHNQSAGLAASQY